jgi:hypothetical protein
MVVSEQKNVFVTFGAGRSGWIGAAKRITREAERTGLFEFCFNLDEQWLQTWDPEIYKIGLNLRKNHPPRGFGYWTWKPSVLMWAHLNFPSHQIIYVDSGSEFQFEEEKLESLRDLLDYVNQVGGTAFSLPEHPERNWTKKDVFIKLKVSKDHFNSPQIQSGFVALNSDSKRKELISSWRVFALLEDGFYFSDESRVNGDIGFIEHRHDQSILSCLWKSLNFPSIEDPSQPNLFSNFGIIAYRNNSRLRMNSNWVLRKFMKYSYLIRDKVLSFGKYY